MHVNKSLLILLLICFSFCSSSLEAQNEGPQIMLPDSVFIFGFLPTDAKVEYSFAIVNTGNDTLHIDKVATDCGCTTAPSYASVVAPGDSTYVPLYFDPKRMKNLVKKGANIYSNDPLNPKKYFSFMAICDRKHPYISFKPEVINMGRLSAEKLDKTFTAEITNLIDTPIDLSVLYFTNSYVDVELEDTILMPGKSTTLEMTLRRIPVDPKHFAFSVTLSSTIEDKSWNFTIPAFGRMDIIE